MRRALLLLLAVALVVPGGAHAKGPHAVLAPGPGAVEADRPWNATIEFLELGRPRPARLVARRGDVEVVASLRRVRSRLADVRRYEVELTFPSRGRWRLIATADGRFEFDPIFVGGGSVPHESVAFAGVPPQPVGAPAEGSSLRPKEYVFAAQEAHEARGGGFPIWVVPLAGVVLAGAGLVRARLR